MKININNKIYLICKGTSTNDIINSINIIKEKKSFFDFFNKKKNTNTNINLEKEEFSPLDNIGINELLILGKNENNKGLIDNKLSKILKIYCSLEYSTIESSLIISKDIPNIMINPLPYMSNKTNIINKDLLYIFKNKFGDKYDANSNVTNIDLYWKIKSIHRDFLDIKNISSKINWNNINPNNTSSLNSYNLSKIKDFFKDISIKTVYYPDTLNNVILVAEGKLIEDILKLCKEIKYNKKRYIIESSSIWEINISCSAEIDSNKIIKNSEIKFDSFKKIYPIEYNYKPLKYNSEKNTYDYEYNDYKYILFNSLEKIPIKYIKNMELQRLPTIKRNIIKKCINKSKNKNNTKKSEKDLDKNKDYYSDNKIKEIEINTKKFKFN